MKPKLILVGAGGHCRSVIDVIEVEGIFDIAGIVDVPEKVGTKVFEYTVVGNDEDLPRLVKEFRFFCITVGHVITPVKRKKLFNSLQKMGGQFPVIRSPHAYISQTAQIGDGTVVMHRAVLNVNARVGSNCILNTASVVEHDSIVGDHCHIGPLAAINGGCKIESDCLIGSSAVILPGKTVGRNSIVAAGSVVLQDMKENVVLAGNPGTIKKVNE